MLLPFLPVTTALQRYVFVTYSTAAAAVAACGAIKVFLPL